MTVNVNICVQTRTLRVYVNVVALVMIALQIAETELWLLRDMLISGKYKTLFMPLSFLYHFVTHELRFVSFQYVTCNNVV